MNTNKMYFIVYQAPGTNGMAIYTFLSDLYLTEEFDWYEPYSSFTLSSYLDDLISRLSYDCAYNQRVTTSPHFFSTFEEAKSALLTIKAHEKPTLGESYYIIHCETKIIPERMLEVFS